MCLLFWFGDWLDFLFREFIIDANVRGVFKDFTRMAFPSLTDLCENDPPEKISRKRAASLLRP